MNKPIQQLHNKLNDILDNKTLIKLKLSNKKERQSDLKNILITIVKIKQGYRLNFVYHHDTKDVTKNYDFDLGLELIIQALDEQFYDANILTSLETLTFISNAKGKSRLTIKQQAPSEVPMTQASKRNAFTHDKVKNRLIKTENNIYLRELGVISKEWKVKHDMSDKYRQINRYIELLSPYIKDLDLTSDTQSHIVDMGSGKGYLTFSLYDYLKEAYPNKFKIIGIEFRQNLVEKCNQIAQQANFEHLSFIKGSIEKAEVAEIDILIALHACDTATDEAIYRGIEADAELIVCAPCCHKQIRKELNVNNELSHIVEHGILKERQAEIITDTLRALIMEAYGYKTKIFEFISTEHTPKNLMIVGRKIKNKKVERIKILEEVAALKNTYGIKSHYLEVLLNI